MPLETKFKLITLDRLQRVAAVLKAEGYRFVQMHAVNADWGVDLYYSFMKDGVIENYRIKGLKERQPVPSITNLFLAAFVFENEARELFGVDMRDVAIDFGGAMYTLAESEPMTFMSPEQKAARDKARAAAAKKAESASRADAPAGAAPAATPPKRIFIMTPERQARLDAKMATMSPEKKAKVEAALAARAAEAAAFNAASSAEKPAEHAQDAKESAPKPEKPESKAETASSKPSAEEKSPASLFADERLETLIYHLDADKAAIVRKALSMKGGE